MGKLLFVVQCEEDPASITQEADIQMALIGPILAWLLKHSRRQMELPRSGTSRPLPPEAAMPLTTPCGTW